MAQIIEAVAIFIVLFSLAFTIYTLLKAPKVVKQFVNDCITRPVTAISNWIFKA